MKEFLLEVSGTTLQGYAWEPEDKAVEAVVVIVHGLGEHARRYDEYAGYFASQGLAVFSMDLRGHGRSPGKRGHTSPRSTILKDVDTLCEYAAKAYPGIPVFIYGHSMGGNIGLHHRIDGGFRPRGYVITSPWIKLYKEVSKAKLLLVRLLSKIKPDLCIVNGIEDSSITSVESQLIHGDPLYHYYVSVSTALDCNDMAERILAKSHEDHGDLLLFHGMDDTLCSIEGSRAFMKNASKACTFREWEGCRHELQRDKDREAVREAIRDWILQRC